MFILFIIILHSPRKARVQFNLEIVSLSIFVLRLQVVLRIYSLCIVIQRYTLGELLPSKFFGSSQVVLMECSIVFMDIMCLYIFYSPESGFHIRDLICKPNQLSALTAYCGPLFCSIVVWYFFVAQVCF